MYAFKCTHLSTEHARPACRVAHPGHSLLQNVNNASALRAFITYSGPLRALGVLQGSLARPACRVAHPAQALMQNVNNASALRASITYSVPLRAWEVLQGSLAHPVCRVAHPAQSLMQKMSTMRQHCEHALLTPRPFGPWEYRFGLKTTFWHT